MRVRFIDRILIAVMGILMLAAGFYVVVVGFGWSFAQPFTAMIQNYLGSGLNAHSTIVKIIVIVVCVLIIAMGIYGISALFRRNRSKKFVSQQTEYGNLNISIKAIENMVNRCIDSHEELSVSSSQIQTDRSGIIVKLKIGLATGINIPLAVSSLQKQIKNYVTACSGIDVSEVKISVETGNDKKVDSAFNVSTMLNDETASNFSSEITNDNIVNSDFSSDEKEEINNETTDKSVDEVAKVDIEESIEPVEEKLEEKPVEEIKSVFEETEDTMQTEEISQEDTDKSFESSDSNQDTIKETSDTEELDETEDKKTFNF